MSKRTIHRTVLSIHIRAGDPQLNLNMSSSKNACNREIVYCHILLVLSCLLVDFNPPDKIQI